MNINLEFYTENDLEMAVAVLNDGGHVNLVWRGVIIEDFSKSDALKILAGALESSDMRDPKPGTVPN